MLETGRVVRPQHRFEEWTCKESADRTIGVEWLVKGHLVSQQDVVPAEDALAHATIQKVRVLRTSHIPVEPSWMNFVVNPSRL